MTIEDFPDTPSGRPAWLMTLADLALLLVGFFVFVQAAQHLDQRALANGIREGFGAAPTAAAAPPPKPLPEPMPVDAAAMLNFAPGSARLPGSPAGIVAWAREATRDPRVTIRIAGSADGSAADVDADTGSAAVLAADRARAVAATLARAHAVPPGRTTILNAPDAAPGGHGRRAVIVTLGFAGVRQ